MNTTHTPGPWAYDENRNAIYSTVEFIIEPDKEQDEEGIPVDIISTRAAMGGNDTKADIKLLTAAPCMLEALNETLSALKAIAADYPEDTYWNEVIQKAETAIQKATQP